MHNLKEFLSGRLQTVCDDGVHQAEEPLSRHGWWQRKLSEVSETLHWRPPPRHVFSERRSMTEAVQCRCLARAEIVSSTGAVLEA